MSDNLSKKPRIRKEYDKRSFIEIWYSLPDLARENLIATFKAQGYTRANWFWWAAGTLPNKENRKKIAAAFKKCFDINTKPETLFPGTVKERNELAKVCYEKYKEGKWNGAVKWAKNDEEKQTTEDDSK